MPVAREHDTGEVLDVDLVHDAGARRDDLELVEGGLAPAQELVALDVALVLEFDVAGERVGRAEQIGDHRVVDDQLGRRERVDAGGVAAELDDRFAHGGQVDDRRDAGEVLHHDACGGELDLGVGLGVRRPVGESLDLGGRDVGAVLGAQQVLEQDLQAERQPLGTGHIAQREDVVALAADGELGTGSEAVLALCWHWDCASSAVADEIS